MLLQNDSRSGSFGEMLRSVDQIAPLRIKLALTHCLLVKMTLTQPGQVLWFFVKWFTQSYSEPKTYSTFKIGDMNSCSGYYWGRITDFIIGQQGRYKTQSLRLDAGCSNWTHHPTEVSARSEKSRSMIPGSVDSWAMSQVGVGWCRCVWT